jgi:hypothetical protein
LSEFLAIFSEPHIRQTGAQVLHQGIFGIVPRNKMPRQKGNLDTKQRKSSSVALRELKEDSQLRSIEQLQIPSTSESPGSKVTVFPNTPSSNNDCPILDLPKELHVRILSCLRADCLAKVQLTCRSFNSPDLVHSIVTFASEYVYPPEMTTGFEKQPIGSAVVSPNPSYTTKNKKTVMMKPLEDSSQTHFTFEHLRNMELLVIARVLSSPEPSVGFVVSKSWCKSALKWLEVQQEDRCTPSKKTKGSKKNVRTRQRHLSENVVLCPNVNSDITCPHDQLQHLNNNKSARARRRLLDRKAWKILKTLYPESTPLESVFGECVLCLAEAETTKKNKIDEKENEKLRRKLPLADPHLRRFYTRTRGVPEDCIRTSCISRDNNASDTKSDCHDANFESDEDTKMAERPRSSNGIVDFKRITTSCPLINGSYYILPRSWCHGWRRYMKTGEGELMKITQRGYDSNSRNTCAFPPPDAAGLLCDAHSIALLPPHLESYLFDDVMYINGSCCFDQKQLLRRSSTNDYAGASREPLNSHPAPASLPSSLPTLVTGQGPTEDSINAMRLAGLSEQEVNTQLSAMRNFEQQQLRSLEQENEIVDETSNGVVSFERRRLSDSFSNSELLDRENHAVVEIVTKDEFRALERCWPGTTLFALRVTVSDSTSLLATSVHFNTPICRECDVTGRQCSVVIKNRARGWLRKSSEKARAPASLEY